MLLATVTLYYFASSRPGRPPKRGPVGLSLPASHMSNQHPMKKHRLDNGDYLYENGHMTGKRVLNKSYGFLIYS